MTPDAERAESTVAHCQHTAGATYGADRGACAVCIATSYAALHASRLRLATALVDYMTGFDPKEIASGHFTTLIATRDEAQRIVREEE